MNQLEKTNKTTSINPKTSQIEREIQHRFKISEKKNQKT